MLTIKTMKEEILEIINARDKNFYKEISKEEKKVKIDSLKSEIAYLNTQYDDLGWNWDYLDKQIAFKEQCIQLYSRNILDIS